MMATSLREAMRVRKNTETVSSCKNPGLPLEMDIATGSALGDVESVVDGEIGRGRLHCRLPLPYTLLPTRSWEA